MKVCAVCIKIALKLETHVDMLNSQTLENLKMFRIEPEELTKLEMTICKILDFELWGWPTYNDFFNRFGQICGLSKNK